jgi:hypothetical protein
LGFLGRRRPGHDLGLVVGLPAVSGVPRGFSVWTSFLAKEGQLMSMNENPQVIQWANQRSRKIADLLTSLYWQLQSYLTDWSAQGIGAIISAGDPTQTVDDGAASDGRQQITGQQLLDLTTVGQALVVAAGTAVPGGSLVPATVAGKIQVNGSPR